MNDVSPRCPTCGMDLDVSTQVAADGAPNRPPAPDDISLCFYCHTTLIVTPDLQFRPITAEEFVDLPVELRSMIHRIVQVLDEIKRPE